MVLYTGELIDNREADAELLRREHIEAQKIYQKYDKLLDSDEFKQHLKTVILATRHSGSGAVACRGALLSLYNGYAYPCNLSNFHNLDNGNHRAVMYVIEVFTRTNPMPIDEILPEYQADFYRMQQEVSDINDKN